MGSETDARSSARYQGANMPEEEEKADTHRCPRACRTLTAVRCLAMLIQVALTVFDHLT